MFLAADVGGTKTLLAVYDSNIKAINPVKKQKVISKNYSSLTDLIKEFLDQNDIKVEAATCGIAGPVMDGVVSTPNLPWKVEKRDLENLLGTKKVFLINDLLANAYGIETLKEEDFYIINKGEKDPTGNQAIISAGTGLGEAGLVCEKGGYRPFASEGGHASFSCHQKEDAALFSFLYEKYQGHVSTERALSGQGLENLYSFVVEVERAASLHNEKKISAQLISEHALEKNCPASQRALDIFVRLYGAEAGDFALKIMATAGVFIGGGIAPKILKNFNKELFFKAFVDKGRLKPLLEKIPIKVILNEETALQGAALYTKRQLY